MNRSLSTIPGPFYAVVLALSLCLSVTGTAASLTLSPIHINDVHENDITATGLSPVPNVALTIKINGQAGISTANSDSAGMFAIVLATAAKAGNFVEVSGKASNGTAIYGSTTVLAAQAAAAPPSAGGKPPTPVVLATPTISAAHDGDSVVTVTQNSADASQAGLSIHVSAASPDTPGMPLWQADCSPDSKTGSCSVTANPPPLRSGQVISAAEVVISSGSKVQSKTPAQSTVAAAQGLGNPTVSASEGLASVSVSPDKSDAGKPGLGIFVSVVDPTVDPPQIRDAGSCMPDTAGDKCQIALKVNLNGAWKIQAISRTPSAASATVTADVTPLAALNAPTLTAPFQGDRFLTAALNSTDATGVKPPLQLRLQFTVRRAGSKDDSAPVSCIPDSSGSCRVAVAELLDGDTVTCAEAIAGLPPRVSDATVTAAVKNGALGVPSISKVTEGDKSATITLNDTDLQHWKGKLSLAVNVYSGDDKVGQTIPCTPADATPESCVVTVPALSFGETLRARETPGSGGPSRPGPEAVKEVSELGYNWGRARAYFSLGTVFSRNTISTASGIAQTNFTSPDAFAAFDFDFNWFTRQGCLASGYVSRTVSLATLADAIAECEPAIGKTKKLSPMPNAADASVPQTPLGTQRKVLRSLLGVARDANTRAILSFLETAYRRAIEPDGAGIPDRLKDILGHTCTLPPATDANAPIGEDCRQLIHDLTSVELNAQEAEQLLVTADEFEPANKGGFLVNTYFQSKLTQTAASNGFALASSPNSFHVETGIYAPFYRPWSHWPYEHKSYAFFVAPIAKLGFDSLRGSATDQLSMLPSSGTPATPGAQNFNNAVNALNKDIYRMIVGGARVGLLRLSPRPNRAPETISYIDFTYGRFDNYFTQKYNDSSGAVRYPWRFDVTGLFKIPITPVYIGLDLNKGTGPDNLSIFIGLRTDLSALLQKLVTLPSTQ